jgi:hypothetical protein
LLTAEMASLAIQMVTLRIAGGQFMDCGTVA